MKHKRPAEDVDEPTDVEYAELVKNLAKTYNCWRDQPENVDDPMRFFEEQFELGIKELDFDSTTGCCALKNYGTTWKEVLRWDGEQVCPDRKRIVMDYVRYRFKQLLDGVEVADNINVFIKQEPHKASKIESGMFRIISGVSGIDTFVDRVLFGWLMRKTMTTVTKTPCAIGWSPIKGGHRYLTAQFAGYKKFLCLDRKAWDWSVQGWVIGLWADFLIEMMKLPPTWWVNMVLLRTKLLFRLAKFQFSDGTVVEQPHWGIQKSGCLLTTLLNSIGTDAMSTLADIRLGVKIITPKFYLGDDSLEPWREDVEEYVRHLERLGAYIKEVHPLEYMEFVGHLFHKGRVYPAYWQKHLFALQHASLDVLGETLESYQIIYAHDDDMLLYMQRVALKWAPDHFVSKRQAGRIMDG